MGDGVQRGDPSLPWSTWDVLTIDPSKVLGVLGRVLMGWRIIDKQKGRNRGDKNKKGVKNGHRGGEPKPGLDLGSPCLPAAPLALALA